jgi:BASS family bile acid:Na+ symporter
MFADVNIAFSPTSLVLLNGILACMMFGVSMQLQPEDFRRVLKQPRAPLAGLAAQFLVLPAATCLVKSALAIAPPLALGMILVASCPGGTFSNIMTWLGKASVPISVTMTAISSLAAVVMTPLNFALYGYLNPYTRPILRDIEIDPLGMLLLVGVVLALPLLAGMLLGRFRPSLARRAEKPMRLIALIILLVFVIIATIRNFDLLLQYGDQVAGLALGHNLLALGLGAMVGRLIRLARDERRAVTMEVGIQNSALGLSILFTFFPQAGGMMLITAFWGVCHLLTGLSLALFWSSKRGQRYA